MKNVCLTSLIISAVLYLFCTVLVLLVSIDYIDIVHVVCICHILPSESLDVPVCMVTFSGAFEQFLPDALSDHE